MAKTHIEIDIFDDNIWPKMKMIINRDGAIRTEGPFQYDIAGSQFEPAVKDTLRFAVEGLIKQRRR